MIFRARYTDRTIITDDWRTLPDSGLLWVDVWWKNRHRLIYADYYWALGNKYGMVYDGTHCPASCATWHIGERGRRTTPPPRDAYLIAGGMIADEEWARLRRES